MLSMHLCKHTHTHMLIIMSAYPAYSRTRRQRNRTRRSLY